MTRDLLRRILKLEGRINRPAGEGNGPLMIVVYGGLAREPMHATIGSLHIDRASGEPLDAFRDRCREIGANAGEAIIVVGGLPPSNGAISGSIWKTDELPDPFGCIR